jgi:hypothetical protein
VTSAGTSVAPYRLPLDSAHISSRATPGSPIGRTWSPSRTAPFANTSSTPGSATAVTKNPSPWSSTRTTGITNSGEHRTGASSSRTSPHDASAFRIRGICSRASRPCARSPSASSTSRSCGPIATGGAGTVPAAAAVSDTSRALATPSTTTSRESSKPRSVRRNT